MANKTDEITLFRRAAVVGRRWIFPFLIALAILLPQGITQGNPYGLQLPRIFGEGTDEEAYLIMVNSLIRDGDLDLRNNYRAAETGSRQGGLKAAGHPLFHHSTYYLNDERLLLLELEKRGINPASLGPEYPAHPVGIALLLVPFLWVFRTSPDLVESVSVLFAGISTIIGMLLARQILIRRGYSARIVHLTIVAVFLSSPVWFYSRGFFNEPFLLLMVVGAYWIIETGRTALWGGAFVAGAMLMKPQMALFVGALAVPMLWDRQWKRLLGLALFPVLALILILVLNAHMFGSVFRGPYQFQLGNPVEALVGLLISRDRGLLWYSPALLLAFAGWWMASRADVVRSMPVVLGALFQFGVVILWAEWTGGWSYGPRLLVPILPLFGLGLAETLRFSLWDRFMPRWILYNLIVYGLVINGLAVSRYWIAWTTAGGPPKFLGRLLWLELTQ